MINPLTDHTLDMIRNRLQGYEREWVLRYQNNGRFSDPSRLSWSRGDPYRSWWQLHKRKNAVTGFYTYSV